MHPASASDTMCDGEFHGLIEHGANHPVPLATPMMLGSAHSVRTPAGHGLMSMTFERDDCKDRPKSYTSKKYHQHGGGRRSQADRSNRLAVLRVQICRARKDKSKKGKAELRRLEAARVAERACKKRGGNTQTDKKQDGSVKEGRGQAKKKQANIRATDYHVIATCKDIGPAREAAGHQGHRCKTTGGGGTSKTMIGAYACANIGCHVTRQVHRVAAGFEIREYGEHGAYHATPSEGSRLRLSAGQLDTLDRLATGKITPVSFQTIAANFGITLGLDQCRKYIGGGTLRGTRSYNTQDHTLMDSMQSAIDKAKALQTSIAARCWSSEEVGMDFSTSCTVL